MAAPILLCTLNARYPHSAFGLRYLMANLGELRPQARILEFTINENPRDIAAAILAREPRIVGLGVYIWNTEQTAQVVSILKRVAPEILVVLGGPEVSHEAETQPICRAADFVLQGEADFLFRDFCQQYLSEGRLPDRKFIQAPLPEISQIASPYPLYTDEDLRNRVLYVEASRGCPYKCEYCLSSLDKSVRSFEIGRFLDEMEELIRRGARSFKFVDRTFNLSVSTGARILEFFLQRSALGLFLHFEMVPDRLPAELRELIRKFPPGSLQFEIGIQTWNPEVARLVSRRQDYAKIEENFRFLRNETGAHLHADLIAGLPGETLESFAAGFDAVSALGPHEIQVGLLKRLKGTPITRHDAEWDMAYQEHPPFQILRTRAMDFGTIQRIGRFSRFWDLYGNSGEFKKTMELLFAHAPHAEREGRRSPFQAFLGFSEFLSSRHPQGHGIALLNRVESAWLYLTGPLGLPAQTVRQALAEDYAGTIKRDLPDYLKAPGALPPKPLTTIRRALPPRQARHHSS